MRGTRSRAAMRYAVGSLVNESNSFSPSHADRDYFLKSGYLLFGEEVLPYHVGRKNELSGFIAGARERDVELLPLCAAWAVPYGNLEGRFYEQIKREFVARYRQAGTPDGLYLSLHGSMGVEGIDDAEGDLIEAMREVHPHTPITVTLDFHANVTRRMVENADILIGYNSFPHTNMYETGLKAAEAAIDRFDRIEGMRKLFLKLPIVAPLERMTVAGDEPMARLVKVIEEVELHKGVVALSLFCVHIWRDGNEMGSSLVAVAEEPAVEYCQEKMTQLAERFWSDRESYFDFPFCSPAEAISRALAMPEQPVLINEPSDNAGAGATGDSTFFLRALLESGADVPTILTIADPETVQEAIALGVGREGTFNLGGKINESGDSPVRVQAKVRTIHDGRYSYAGEVMHGMETSMGRTCVLQIKRNICVQVTELPVFTIDPEHYRCVGLHPERMKMVLVKSQGSYKAAYERISQRVIYIDTPGLARSNVFEVPYRRIDKGSLYPFNRNANFDPRRDMVIYENNLS